MKILLLVPFIYFCFFIIWTVTMFQMIGKEAIREETEKEKKERIKIINLATIVTTSAFFYFII